RAEGDFFLSLERENDRMTAIRRVGVLGCGLMGSGIAQVCAQAGFDVVVRDVSAEAVAAGLASIDKRLARLEEKESISSADRAAARGRIRGTEALDDLAEVDLVIEAIVEDPEVKNQTWKELDTLCQPKAIFASNTSSLTIADMAAV